MGNLLFSPNGRIGPSEFTKGIMILAVISAIISLTPLVNMGLAMILGFASFILLVPFFMLNIKRAHDAGKSGWMSLLHLLIYIILGVVLSVLVGKFFSGGVDPEAVQAAAEAAAASGDIAGVMNAAAGPAKAQAIPGAIGGLIIAYVFAMIVNMINKRDEHENQYGPA
ncbi:MAG: DUF805 domain-containing protein [Hellea sp.]